MENSVTSPLSVHHIHKSYLKRPVLNDISFSLVPGEIFGLIGLNGAGKTTLIKIILDLANAGKGEARIFNAPTSDLKARRELSYLPEKFQPSRYLKGMEYLDLALSYYGKKLDAEKAREGAVALDLDPNVLNARVGSYSKGMGQKLGLLGAFMIDASLFILDEPMSGLDPRARIKLKNMLLATKARGKTVFFSSHILSDIDEICDRIGVIHEGRLFFIGTPKEFKMRFGNDSLEKAFLNSIQAPTAAAA
jgi:ABC-2 type transport system ATP-binding protein